MRFNTSAKSRFISLAITELYPDAGLWLVMDDNDYNTYDLITENGEPEGVDVTTILALAESKQAEWEYDEYQRLRKAEYDKLNQDELRFDDLMNGTTTWQDAILAIKNKYPKP